MLWYITMLISNSSIFIYKRSIFHQLCQFTLGSDITQIPASVGPVLPGFCVTDFLCDPVSFVSTAAQQNPMVCHFFSPIETHFPGHVPSLWWSYQSYPHGRAFCLKLSRMEDTWMTWHVHGFRMNFVGVPLVFLGKPSGNHGAYLEMRVPGVFPVTIIHVWDKAAYFKAMKPIPLPISRFAMMIFVWQLVLSHGAHRYVCRFVWYPQISWFIIIFAETAANSVSAISIYFWENLKWATIDPNKNR